MPPKLKRTTRRNQKNPECLEKDKENESLKTKLYKCPSVLEKKSRETSLVNKNVMDSNHSLNVNKHPQIHTILEINEESDERKTTAEIKPFSKESKQVGFWSKKLQDLEECVTKNKKCGLYDFSGTDESDASFKAKKKRKQKLRAQRKKKVIDIKCNKKCVKQDNSMIRLEKKSKEIHRQSFCREQIMLNKERRQLAVEGKNFTLSTGIPFLGVTSTPAVNKDNLIGASKFLFLSPIAKDFEMDDCVTHSLKTESVHKNFKNDSDLDKDQETPKKRTNLKIVSGSRVLRNRKR